MLKFKLLGDNSLVAGCKLHHHGSENIFSVIIIHVAISHGYIRQQPVLYRHNNIVVPLYRHFPHREVGGWVQIFSPIIFQTWPLNIIRNTGPVTKLDLSDCLGEKMVLLFKFFDTKNNHLWCQNMVS